MHDTMEVNEKLIQHIRIKLHQPKGYHLVLCGIIGHGRGVVVNYMVEPIAGRPVEYRTAGFVPKANADLGIACVFDMIIQ